MTPSTHASLRVIAGPLQAGDGRHVVARAGASIVPSSRLSDYIVLSALYLLAAVAIWRRLKTELFGSYHPELHYMRGPGPKYREKHARDDAVAR